VILNNPGAPQGWQIVLKHSLKDKFLPYPFRQPIGEQVELACEWGPTEVTQGALVNAALNP
jgi:hypothetical protein